MKVGTPVLSQSSIRVSLFRKASESEKFLRLGSIVPDLNLYSSGLLLLITESLPLFLEWYCLCNLSILLLSEAPSALFNGHL